jgi:hypothetical protein
MLSMLRFVVFAGLASGVGLAENWSGALVDAKCYGSRERNVSHQEQAGRNIRADIKHCAPKAKTKEFGIVQDDGTSLTFDSAGCQKAADFLKTAGKQSPLMVTVTGAKDQNTVKVDSISPK